jgi:hypothetical protein
LIKRVLPLCLYGKCPDQKHRYKKAMMHRMLQANEWAVAANCSVRLAWFNLIDMFGGMLPPLAVAQPAPDSTLP